EATIAPLGDDFSMFPTNNLRQTNELFSQARSDFVANQTCETAVCVSIVGLQYWQCDVACAP
ncbi:MAG: hypothetical protein ACI90G_000231, partial [Urechidicola sp.]